MNFFSQAVAKINKKALKLQSRSAEQDRGLIRHLQCNIRNPIIAYPHNKLLGNNVLNIKDRDGICQIITVDQVYSLIHECKRTHNEFHYDRTMGTSIDWVGGGVR